MKKNSSHYICLVLLCLCFAWAEGQAQNIEWAGLQRYAQANKELPQPGKKEKRVVFMGNSITEWWVSQRPSLPALVVINAGTNDVAENAGPYNEDYTFGNILSMVELAQAHQIKVILTSTLPAAAFGWNPRIKNAAAKIASLNARVREYAEEHHIPYVDYYQAMVYGENKALNPAYSNDGVHPTEEGYKVMEALIKPAIERVLEP